MGFKEPMLQENHSLNIWERKATSNKGLMKTKQTVHAVDREMKRGDEGWCDKPGEEAVRLS